MAKKQKVKHENPDGPPEGEAEPKEKATRERSAFQKAASTTSQAAKALKRLRDREAAIKQELAELEKAIAVEVQRFTEANAVLEAERKLLLGETPA